MWWVTFPTSLSQILFSFWHLRCSVVLSKLLILSEPISSSTVKIQFPSQRFVRKIKWENTRALYSYYTFNWPTLFFLSDVTPEIPSVQSLSDIFRGFLLLKPLFYGQISILLWTDSLLWTSEVIHHKGRKETLQENAIWLLVTEQKGEDRLLSFATRGDTRSDECPCF